MADAFRRVQAGDPFDFPARAYNAFLDSHEFTEQQKQKLSVQMFEDPPPNNVVLVRNETDEDFQRDDVIGFDEPIMEPGPDGFEAFRAQILFKGSIPDIDQHAGRFGLCLEPIEAGGMGLVQHTGLAFCRVWVTDKCHSFAEVRDGDHYQLESGTEGSAEIIWKDNSGLAATTTTTTTSTTTPAPGSTTTTTSTSSTTSTTTTSTTPDPCATTTSTTTPDPALGSQWAIVKLGSSLLPKVCTSTTTSTTTLPGGFVYGTPATSNPCTGQCKWTWNSTTKAWSLTIDGCSTTTTTTTPAPTTTAGPTSSTTSTTSTTPACTSTTTSTTTLPPCSCTAPTFCGSFNGECVYTSCGSLATSTAALNCASTTTTSTTSTTSTTAAPVPCGPICTWESHITGTAIMYRWGKVGNPCGTDCACDPPAATPGCCDTATTACYPLPPPATTPPPQPCCDGFCYWQWEPCTSTWLYFNPIGSTGATGGGAYELFNGCRYHAGTFPFNCGCEPPSYSGGSECVIATTSCGANVAGIPPCGPPEGTTPEPCDSTCKWRWIVGPPAHWSLVIDKCSPNCSCSYPSGSGAGSCDTRLTTCNTTTTTTTLPPTTTTSTTTTTTTTTSCPGTCTALWTGSGWTSFTGCSPSPTGCSCVGPYATCLPCPRTPGQVYTFDCYPTNQTTPPPCSGCDPGDYCGDCTTTTTSTTTTSTTTTSTTTPSPCDCADIGKVYCPESTGSSCVWECNGGSGTWTLITQLCGDCDVNPFCDSDCGPGTNGVQVGTGCCCTSTTTTTTTTAAPCTACCTAGDVSGNLTLSVSGLDASNACDDDPDTSSSLPVTLTKVGQCEWRSGAVTFSGPCTDTYGGSPRYFKFDCAFGQWRLSVYSDSGFTSLVNSDVLASSTCSSLSRTFTNFGYATGDDCCNANFTVSE